MSARSHHPILSGSVADRVIACPGSPMLIRQLGVRSQPNRHSARGTILHGLAEDVLLKGPDVLDRLAGTVKEADGFKVFLTDEDLDAVRSSAAIISKQLDREDYECVVEQKAAIPVKVPDNEEQPSGYADVIAWQETLSKGWVVDLKFGKGFVSEHTAQLKTYALSGVNWLEGQGIFLDEVDMTIVQPMAPDADGRIWRTLTMSVPDLKHWGETVLQVAVDRAFAPNAELVPGAQCTYCPARGQCPALERQHADLVRLAHEADMVPAGLSDSEIAGFLDRFDLVETFIEGVRAEAMARLDNGRPIDGWALTPKRAIRKWISEEAAMQLMVTAGVTESDMPLEVKLLSPTQTEKRFPDAYRIAKAQVDATSSGFNLSRVKTSKAITTSKED